MWTTSAEGPIYYLDILFSFWTLHLPVFLRAPPKAHAETSLSGTNLQLLFIFQLHLFIGYGNLCIL